MEDKKYSRPGYGDREGITARPPDLDTIHHHLLRLLQAPHCAATLGALSHKVPELHWRRAFYRFRNGDSETRFLLKVTQPTQSLNPQHGQDFGPDPGVLRLRGSLQAKMTH